MIFVTGLLIYHIGLVLKSLTTKEELGGFFENFYGNPYKRLIPFEVDWISFPALMTLFSLNYLTLLY